MAMIKFRFPVLVIVILLLTVITTWGQTWELNKEGYPSIDGTWFDVSQHHKILIKQQGRSFVATHTRKTDYGTVFSWEAQGIITR
jgi:hypothetical protein